MRAPGHVVITGAAGAIGAALARAMRAAWPDVHLALVDRDAAALEVLAREVRQPADRRSGDAPVMRGGDRAGETASAARGSRASAGASIYVADLTKLDALPALIASIEENGPIDGLVNCAGIMRVQHVSSWNWNDAEQLLAVDLLAPLRLQDLVVRGMVERGAGLIINISSMAGRVPLRGCTYYGAAKAGLAMASEIARADLAGHGVQVLTVYPGPVRSALEAGARADYGGGGLFGRFAPTGEPAELAARIMSAVAADEPRVIYPRLYGVGWTAPNLSSWIALSYGPPPAH
jgi:dehydrogenase/reductase SDR family member 7B